MAFLYCAAALGVFLVSCSATFTLVEAYRTGDLATFRIALRYAVPLCFVTLVLAVMGARFGLYDDRSSDHVGFTPDWHCVGRTSRTSDVCIRDASRPKAIDWPGEKLRKLALIPGQGRDAPQMQVNPAENVPHAGPRAPIPLPQGQLRRAAA